MQPCPTQDVLNRLLAEQLPPPERSALETHVEQCSLCQQTLDRLTRDSLVASLARADRPLDFLRPSTRPGTLGWLAHYEVLEVLGKGGFGIVLKAFDEKLQRLVAIKVLSPQLAGNATACQRFVREARAAAAVRDAHVVKVFDVAEDPLPYLVMELVNGQTLQQKIDQTGALDVQDVLRIGAKWPRAWPRPTGRDRSIATSSRRISCWKGPHPKRLRPTWPPELSPGRPPG